jgi:hypothetical protein
VRARQARRKRVHEVQDRHATDRRRGRGPGRRSHDPAGRCAKYVPQLHPLCAGQTSRRRLLTRELTGRQSHEREDTRREREATTSTVRGRRSPNSPSRIRHSRRQPARSRAGGSEAAGEIDLPDEEPLIVATTGFDPARSDEVPVQRASGRFRVEIIWHERTRAMSVRRAFVHGVRLSGNGRSPHPFHWKAGIRVPGLQSSIAPTVQLGEACHRALAAARGAVWCAQLFNTHQLAALELVSKLVASAFRRTRSGRAEAGRYSFETGSKGPIKAIHLCANQFSFSTNRCPKGCLAGTHHASSARN